MYRLLRPLLFRLDAERAHRLAMRGARLLERAGAPGRAAFTTRSEALRQTLFGLDFQTPVGLAPGFDKNGTHVAAWPSLGFGFAEIGSVTARPSAGNPRPRAFRLPDDRALVNRMGLNNDGAVAVAGRLALLPPERRSIPLGINVSKTHDPGIVEEGALEDFAASVRLLAPLADYLALNISCPNTAEGKTFEEPAALDALLVRAEHEIAQVAPGKPLLVKVSPPPILPGGSLSFTLLDEVVEVATSHGVAGFIATNTTPDRVNLATDPTTLAAIGEGGLSGRPLRERAVAAVRRISHRTAGEVPVIGVGGIDSAEAAYQFVRAGASLVQVYTGLVFEGPGLVRRINRGLQTLLEKDGFHSISQAVGADIQGS